jgi:hypothetical protein
MNRLPSWLVALGAAGTTLIASSPAFALNGPTNIEIDGGPLGPLEMSGGVDGYFYAKTGTDQNTAGDKAAGSVLNNIEIQLQKNTGEIRFDLQIAGYSGYVLGSPYPKQANFNHFTTGPIRNAYVSYVPNSHLTVSVGQMASLEGYESTFAWNNTTGFTTALYEVTNSESRGVSATLTEGPASLQVMYGDGNDTGVFNFVQFLGTYNFSATDNLNIFGGIHLATTGPNAYYYGQDTVGDNNSIYVNSNIFGAYYTGVFGNLMLTPEIQYQYASPNHRYSSDVIPKETSNFGAALFGDYAFGKSPYSIGAWAEYWTSHGSASGDNWFITPNAELVGFTVAPTWQYKDLYLRANAGYLHLLNGTAYGNDKSGTDQLMGTMEAGLVF